MWKIYIYFLWQFRSVEKYLEMMESCGFRVEKVYFGHLFKFKKVQSKPTRYVCSRSFGKDNEMHLYEYEIRKKYGAEEIPAFDLGGICIHRICMPNIDLTFFETKRNKYMRRLIINRIVFIAIYLFGSICATVAYKDIVPVLSVVVVFLSILLMYHLFGYVKISSTGDGSVCSVDK